MARDQLLGTVRRGASRLLRRRGDRASDGGTPGGSGVNGPVTEPERQAGSYGRDAEQDPARGSAHQPAE